MKILKRVHYISLLLSLTFFLTSIPFNVLAQERVVGVKVGDWSKYEDIEVSWNWDYPLPPGTAIPELNDTQWIIYVYDEILGTNVTYHQIRRYKDDTEVISDGWTDVETGRGKLAGIESGNVTGLLISANLSQGDSWYTEVSPSWRINQTQLREYVGVLREVNVINLTYYYTSSYDITVIAIWDKLTGILCELTASYSFGEETVGGSSVRLVETNVWVYMRDLLVPYEAQGNALWCWAASTAMVLRYYGKSVHVWDVGKTRPLLWAMSGIESYIHETYPGEFETKIASYSSISDQTRKDMQGNLSRGYPILLHVDPPGLGTHMVVVIGFNSSGFFINDPSGALFTGFESSASYPYIHEFATWEELQPMIFKELLSNDVFLIVEGTPLPLDATLFLTNVAELGIKTIHDSDSEKGVYVDYGGWWWFLGIFWRHIGGHPIVWDTMDTLNYHYEIFNPQDQEARFDFHLQIIGEDEVVYYEKSILNISVPPFHFGLAWELEIPIKDYLIEGQRYVVAAGISYHGSEETIDSITLPAIYYSARSVMFSTECPVRMLVTDPAGLRVGFDPVSNDMINEIPNALYYYSNNSEPEVISIPDQKIGNYSAKVFGIESGMYNLTCTSLDETGFLFTENLINISIEKNESQTHVFQNFPQDTTPPTISTLSPENKTYPVNDVPLTFTVDESTSWIGYSLNGKMNITISGNYTLPRLSDGTHTITVYANDTAGNMGSSATVYFVVDTVSPNIEILTPKNETYTKSSVTLSFTVDEATSWIGYSSDGQANVTITGNTTLPELSDGPHSLIVYARDIAGNTGASEIIYFSVDAEQPFTIWIVATIVIIVALGTAVYLLKIRRKS